MLQVNITLACETLSAVHEELNEQIILTADTVRHLNSMKQYNIIHVPESIKMKSLVSTVPYEVVVDDDKSIQDDDVILPLDGKSDHVVSLVAAHESSARESAVRESAISPHHSR
jgi:hypothetical protein